MAIKYRTAGAWGAGIGRNLTPAEVDQNFQEHDERIEDLEENPQEAISVTNITQVGKQITFWLADGTHFGPFTLPTAMFRWRGEFAASTSYEEFDLVTYNNTGVFISLQNQISGSAIDTDEENSDGPLWQQAMGAFGVPTVETLAVGSWTLQITDANKYKRCTAGITITVPPNADVPFPIGTESSFRQCHATGRVTIVGDTGVTLNSIEGYDTVSSAQGAVITIKKVATNEWDVFGYLEPVSA